MTPQIAEAILRRLPAELRGAFQRGDRAAFDRAVRAGALFDPVLAAGLHNLSAEHGGDDASPYDVLAHAAREALTARSDRPPPADGALRDPGDR